MPDSVRSLLARLPPVPGQWCFLLLALVLLNGCAVVKVNEKRSIDADMARRADVLSTGRLSADAASNLAITGQTVEACRREPEPCSAVLREALSQDAWLATIAEVRTLRMQEAAGAMRSAPEISAHEAIDVARWAYAYLFMAARSPEQRVFESRQERVLRLYNRAVEVAAQSLFEVARARGASPGEVQAIHNLRLQMALHGLGQKQEPMPEALLASDTLGFDNLRAIFRRDGFGSSLVAAFPRLEQERAAAAQAAGQPPPPVPPYRDTRFLSVTSTLRFAGDSLQEVLASDDVRLDVYNPYLYDSEEIGGRALPLAANFSAAYGVWLARSELARLSLSSLLRPRQERAFDPRVYLGQPYDPNKRVVILVHGLASSPEAWVNLANELLAESELRDEFQIWQVFYPTNLGILSSRANIDRALRATFAHFDPEGDDRASHDAVLVGHSMGGVIARLLVSDSGAQVLESSLQSLPPEQAAALAQEPRVREILEFQPLPQVGRAVFLAAPHRGAELGDAWLPRMVRRVIRLPFTVLNDAAELFQRNSIDEQSLQQVGFRNGRPSTGPDDLTPGSLFMRSTADLPIQAGLPFHTIVGWRDTSVPLELSWDGAVPFSSAHLPGAVSEKAIPSGHSVQETPAAIMELRRILRQDMQELHP